VFFRQKLSISGYLSSSKKPANLKYLLAVLPNPEVVPGERQGRRSPTMPSRDLPRRDCKLSTYAVNAFNLSFKQALASSDIAGTIT
jgi:hypothetical protein